MLCASEAVLAVLLFAAHPACLTGFAASGVGRRCLEVAGLIGRGGADGAAGGACPLSSRATA